MKALALEAGKLYQVKHWKEGWIIAEYIREIAPHSYKYHNLDLNTFKTSAEKTRYVPLSHQWKKIRPKDFHTTFTCEDRSMETRPVTEEAIATIAELKAEIERLDAAHRAKIKELREFCE